MPSAGAKVRLELEAGEVLTHAQYPFVLVWILSEGDPEIEACEDVVSLGDVLVIIAVKQTAPKCSGTKQLFYYHHGFWVTKPDGAQWGLLASSLQYLGRQLGGDWIAGAGIIRR